MKGFIHKVNQWTTEQSGILPKSKLYRGEKTIAINNIQMYYQYKLIS